MRAKSRSLLVALVLASFRAAAAYPSLVELAHAGGRLDDDLALVLAQPRLLLRRAT